MIRWLETISRWLFLLHPNLRVGMQTKVFELCPQCRCISLFFFTLQPEIGRAFPFRYSISGTHTRRDELRRFPLPLLLLPLPLGTLLDVPTLPYLTLHYSPSREVDTKVYKKGSQVPYVAQINIGKGTYLPT